MNFSEKLYELRKKEGFSQEELAEKVDVSRQSVSKWESGQSTPEMDKLILLSNIFNISIDELVGKESINSLKIENNASIKPKKKQIFMKIIAIILIIYLLIVIIKFILLTKQVMIANSFSETNFSIMESIIIHDDAYNENNPSYINVNITKIENKYIETQYNTKDFMGNPSNITYVELDKKTSYEMIYDKDLNKYVLDDALKGYTEEEKNEYFLNHEGSNPVKNLSSMNKDIRKRLLNSINPLLFVNPFTNTFLLVSPFNVTIKYVYNNDYLISRIVTKVWGTNRGSEWIYSYDYVPGHFENRKISSPIESGEYEIVKFEDLIEVK